MWPHFLQRSCCSVGFHTWCRGVRFCSSSISYPKPHMTATNLLFATHFWIAFWPLSLFCLFALTECHILVRVCLLTGVSKVDKFVPLLIRGMLSGGPLLCIFFLASKMALVISFWKFTCDQNAFFVSLVLLNRKLRFFKIPPCSLILHTKKFQDGSEANFLIKKTSFFFEKYYFSSFLLNAFVQSPLGFGFHFKVWLESVNQLGSTFCFLISFREQGWTFRPKKISKTQSQCCLISWKCILRRYNSVHNMTRFQLPLRFIWFLYILDVSIGPRSYWMLSRMSPLVHAHTECFQMLQLFYKSFTKGSILEL